MTTPHDRAIEAAAKAIAEEGTRRFGDVATAWNRMTVSERKACLAMTKAGVSAYLAALAADAEPMKLMPVEKTKGFPYGSHSGDW